jgi:hypothetical protein
VLEVVDAPQLVGRHVLLRRGGIAGDAAPAELVGILRISSQRDVPDVPDTLEPAKGSRSALNERPAGFGVLTRHGRPHRDGHRNRCD